MRFPWVKDLGNVIPRRLRRSTKKGRTQHSSTSRTTTGHDGDSSTSSDIFTSPFSPLTPPSNPSLTQPISTTREPDFEASTNVSSRSSGGVPLAREASDMAQIALPSVQAIVGAIPLVGAPMQAAIGGLLSGLQAIDRRNQNKADLDSLTSRLNRLSCNLCNAPPACNPSEQSRRDSFVRMLQDTSTQVTALHERCLASPSVTQAIAGCFSEIDRFLAEYLWSSQMQSQHDMHEKLEIIRRQREEDRRTVALVGCVTLVDATGHEHAIPVNFCTSFQQLNKMLQVLFECDSIEAHLQRRYVEEGQYDLCIDDGKQVTRLTSHGWSSIATGTKIVMRVIFEEETTEFDYEFDYKCHFCGTVNHIAVGSIMNSLEQQAGCSIDCRGCERRFQISCEPPSAKQSTRSSNGNSTGGSDEASEMQLIRNFLVQQSVTRTTVSCLWLVGDNTTCGFEGPLDAVMMHIRSHLPLWQLGTPDARTECHWQACGHVMRRDTIVRHINNMHVGGIRRRRRI
ncbi:hypothetical protein F4604DRAFT_1908095 [Suillus subluteus]|nr:hypothetical protein F4604DRAFT_1908095 [Suillus subluteus]